MRLKNLLVATPELIDALDMSKTYENSKYNKEEYIRLSKKIKKEIKSLDDDVLLVEIGKDSEFDLVFAVLDNKKKTICYISKCKIEKNEAFGQYAYQSLVWVDKSYRAKLGKIASDVVFECVLKKYKTIATDKLQTIKGMKFWAGLIKTAVENDKGKYFVYFLNLTKHEKALQLIASVEHLKQVHDEFKIWEKQSTGAHKIMIISLRRLTSD